MAEIDPIVVKIQAEFGRFKADMAEIKKSIGSASTEATKASKAFTGMSSGLGGSLKSLGLQYVGFNALIGTLRKTTAEVYKNLDSFNALDRQALVKAQKNIEVMDSSFTKLYGTLIAKLSPALNEVTQSFNTVFEDMNKALGGTKGRTSELEQLANEYERINNLLKENDRINQSIASGGGSFNASSRGRARESNGEDMIQNMYDLEQIRKRMEALGSPTGITPEDAKNMSDMSKMFEEALKAKQELSLTSIERGDRTPLLMDRAGPLPVGAEPSPFSNSNDPLSDNIDSYQSFLVQQKALAETQRSEELNAWAEYQIELGEMENKKYEEELSRIEEQQATARDLWQQQAEYELNMRQQINDELNGIDQEAQRKNAMIWEAGWKGKMSIMGGILGDMSVLMQSENRKMFEVGKAAAIANTVISTYEGAQKSFNSLAGIPIVGPALGGAAAAATIAAGLMRVQQISSTSMGGGGGISAGGGGGGGFAGGSSTQTSQQNVIDATFNVAGTNVSKDQLRVLASGLNELTDDGAKIRSVRVI